MERISIHKTIVVENSLTCLLNLCSKASLACCIVSNESNSDLDYLLAISYNNNAAELNAFADLKNLVETNPDYYFGHLAYGLKAQTHQVQNSNADLIKFPDLLFFSPEVLIKVKANDFEFLVHASNEYLVENTIAHLKDNRSETNASSVQLKALTSKAEYIETVTKIKQHIQRGDIYETNYCMAYEADAVINPYTVFESLNTKAQSPFACFYKLNEKYVLCASPERFLKKTDNKLISQPIKGTSPRGKNEAEDLVNKENLLNNSKERNENVMIVDLVRNDLSMSAAKGSVKVEELFGIYSFNTVHQMISTVSCELKANVHYVDAIKNAFPMGSMTGAPKKRAIELMEQYENFNRGIYSGAIGYIDPKGNFDFNVVIRSIVFDALQHKVNIAAGSAITSLCEPENEYEECLLKLKVLREVLGLNEVKV